MAFGIKAPGKRNPTDTTGAFKEKDNKESNQQRFDKDYSYRPAIKAPKSNQIRFAPATSQLKNGLNFYSKTVLAETENPAGSRDRSQRTKAAGKVDHKR